MVTYTVADVNTAIACNDPLVFVDTVTGCIYSTVIALDGVREPMSFCCFRTLDQLREGMPALEIMPESAAKLLK